MHHLTGPIIAVFVGLMSAAAALAQQPTADSLKFFESNIRPVLATHCYECHSTSSGKIRGGLKVDSREALLRGGDSGPAVVPNSLERSLLYQALSSGDDVSPMPPKGKLPQAVIDDFRKWILMGAPDPRVTTINAAVATSIDVAKGRDYWAYRPVVITRPPETGAEGWARTDIDRFVAAKLTEHGLKPVADATPSALVRRLYFVVTGLPPAPDDLRRWVDRLSAASSEQERQRVVAELTDELLASSRYGERWGRHWLDVARFAESTGGDHNNVYQHAWRYRDYVIDAFNADKPFDWFVREQIAGDLLPIVDDADWANNIIATGFLAVGVKSVGDEDQQKFFADLVDEQIDAVSRAFLATTVACARCHDHKFDPIPQQDYYALAAIFRSTETHYGLLKAQARQATTLIDVTGLGPPPGVPAASQDEYAELVKQRDDAAQAVADAMTKIRGGENVFRGTLRRLRSQQDETEAALQAFSADGQPRVFAMGTQDRDAPVPTRLLVRGELDKPAQVVPRGVLQVLSPPQRHAFPTSLRGSGRLELADWIADAKNPLTARVIVNRVWHWMFGRGLVRTVDDFGRAGEPPMHPELLDYLARRLVESGWSIKALVREIALSRTWQLASTYDEHNFTRDPDNAFFWRMNPRRLEAEAIRDAMLAVSGKLDQNRPLGTYLREVGEGGVGQNVFEPVIRAIDADTRSVYLPRIRSVLPAMLETFDAPDAGLVTGSRDTTASPLQSLFLMNNGFVQDCAAALAERLAGIPPERRIDAAFELTLGRLPSETERRLASPYLLEASQRPTATNDSSPRSRGRSAIRSDAAASSSVSDVARAPFGPSALFCQAMLSCAEFQMID